MTARTLAIACSKLAATVTDGCAKAGRHRRAGRSQGQRGWCGLLELAGGLI
jgi:hypothetical protein